MSETKIINYHKKEEVIERLAALKDYKAIGLFFELLKRLVKSLQLSESDRRLALNVRNDYRRRFSVNLNSRLILAIFNEKDEVWFSFALYKADYERLKKELPLEWEEDFATGMPKYAKKTQEAASILINYNAIAKEVPDELLKCWLICASDYLPAQKASQYYKHNIPLLLEMALNDEIRTEMLEESRKYTPANVFANIQTLTAGSRYKESKMAKGEYEILEPFSSVTKNIKVKNLNSDSNAYPDGWYLNKESQINKQVFVTFFNASYTLSGQSANKQNLSMINLSSFNLILYGPPGTGKTYKLQNEYCKLFKDSGQTSISSEVASAIENIDKIPWWKIVAAVLYKHEKAMKINSIAEDDLIQKKHRNTRTQAYTYISNELLAFADEGSSNINVKYKREYELFTKNSNSEWSIKDRKFIEEIFPDIIDLSKPILISQIENIKKDRFSFITFHQKYSYEDFIEGIKPVLAEQGEERPQNLLFEKKKGIFYESCLAALELCGFKSFDECHSKTYKERTDAFELIKNDPTKQQAIFIDEINRANIAAVFGELITLIEHDKRIGSPNELWVELPYSNDKFCVPPNLYIIGTMNTADKSIALLDIALRRRFEFIGMYPDYSNVGEFEDTLRKLNEKIYSLKKNADFFIGNTFFIGKTKKQSADIFNKKIIPLLMEYFQSKVDTVKEILAYAGVQFEQPSLNNNYQVLIK